MQKEEEQMAKAREKEDAKHERKLAAERKKVRVHWIPSTRLWNTC